MRDHPPFIRFAARASLLLLPLIAVSCALPPREAWRVIQREGLVPYVAMEMGKKPFPTYVRKDVPTHSSKNCCPMMPCRACMAHGKTRVPLRPAAAPAPSAHSAPSSAVKTGSYGYGSTSRYLADNHAPSAPPRSSVSLPVRSTSGPRVVGSVPQAGMATPPVAASTPVGHPMASPFSPVTQPQTSVGAPKLSSVIPPTQKPIARQESPVSAPALKDSKVPVSAAPSRISPPPVAPKTVAPTKVAPTPGPSASSKPPQPAEVTGEVPFGSPIAGRPGMVHSPFASKYQLVDVTGLPPGTEVKCPYTGKLFRVPPGVEASNRLPSKPSTDAP